MIRQTRHEAPSAGNGEYFLIHRWTADDIRFALYTKQELTTLHCIFGYPSVRALQMPQCRANKLSAGAQTAKVIKKIGDNCRVCKEVSSGPRRFKLTVGTQELRFNH